MIRPGPLQPSVRLGSLRCPLSRVDRGPADAPLPAPDFMGKFLGVPAPVLLPPQPRVHFGPGTSSRTIEIVVFVP